MMQRRIFSQRYFSIADVVIFFLIATAIYGVVAIGNEWRADFQPVTQIDLSVWALPYYTILSATRGIVAYFISLAFTLIVGYLAAKSKSAEKLIIPLLDILQSIPVLGFLPGLLLGLVALFPRTNIGLELAATIMIFTGQVWNMTLSYYASLKSVPVEFGEASRMIGLDWYQRLMKVELPFSAVNLAWNSLLSMAGGWFFLIPCEAITLGDNEYRLPGIGAYMDVAIKAGDNRAIALAVVAMVLLILMMDFVIWRPILAWVQRFRMEEVAGGTQVEPLMQIWIRESQILQRIKILYREVIVRPRRFRSRSWVQGETSVDELVKIRAPHFYSFFKKIAQELQSPWMSRSFQVLVGGAALSAMGYGAWSLVSILSKIPPATWVVLLRNTVWTFLRVLVAIGLSTLWAVPVGIWIGTSVKRIRRAQPVIQVLASFPAPMLYPLALGLFFSLGVDFDWASMLLMLLGVQWYVLFNVLAGAMRIPKELNDALALMDASRWTRWRSLYLPSVFPFLVTGWVTAAGGAWNASVVAEYLPYRGTILKTGGLGSTLSVAIANENLTLFAASLSLMVLVVLVLNRLVWAPVYRLANTRFRMDI
jgi:NitT/TauT family transport system permease protein